MAGKKKVGKKAKFKLMHGASHSLKSGGKGKSMGKKMDMGKKDLE